MAGYFLLAGAVGLFLLTRRGHFKVLALLGAIALAFAWSISGKHLQAGAVLALVGALMLVVGTYRFLRPRAETPPVLRHPE